VSVAGGVPLSQRLKDREDDLVDIGDYEQTAAHLYNIVTHEDLMVAAGSKASLYIYNQFDTCCFRLVPHETFIKYLEDAAMSLHKIIRVYVDEEKHAHTMSSRAYVELEQFLDAVLKP
jgi:hypothetical protein